MNPNNKISGSIRIALSGFAGAGKDTAADYLVEQFNFKKLAFAEELKNNVAVSYELPEGFFERKDDPFINYIPSTDSDAVLQALKLHPVELNGNLFITPRIVMIIEGTIKKIFNPYHYRDRLFRKLNEYDNFVVSDLRYLHELQALENAGFVTVRITREPELLPAASANSSENELIGAKFMFEIINKTDNLSDYYLQLQSLLDKICKKLNFK